MNSYRCTICGEVFVGSKLPSECPFCCVRKKYIAELDEVKGEDLFVVKDISDNSRKNLIRALSIETTNASFYKCASEISDSEGMRALFKRLAKIEKEHADIIRKYLELDPIEFMEEECVSDANENIEKAIIIAKETIRFYKEASSNSREAKICSLFRAVSEAEEGCLKLLNSFGVTVSKESEFVPPLLHRVGGR